MARAVAFVILLLVVPTAQGALVLSGFASDLPGATGDDAVEIRNDGLAAERLDGLVVADASGALRLPDGVVLAPGATVRITTNTSAYVLAARAMPDLATDATDGARKVTIANPGFALAQHGDALFLRRGVDTLDAVVYGDSNYEGAGWTGPTLPANDPFLRWNVRVPGQDSDTRADWDTPQHPFLGWRAHELPTFHIAGDATAYTAPDRSRDFVVAAVLGASTHLRINVYEFRDVGIARVLLARMEAVPQLKVDLLEDVTPVGMSAEERMVRDRILYDLSQAGATVRFISHDRYAYDHAKYIVVDDRSALIQTENLVPSALPVDARDGNRGWGVRIDDVAFATTLAAVFDHDFALDAFGARDATPRLAPPPLPASATATPRPRLGSAVDHGLNATLVVTPEANLGPDDPLIAAFADAKEEILIEQLAVPPYWRDAFGHEWPHEYLNAALEAARRGVHVRVLLDGHFLDGGPDDNAATVRRLEEVGKLLPVEARLMDRSGDPVLHVKGVVIDQRRSWVGSMNWNLNSVAQNREVSVLLDGPHLASLYAEAFDQDWARAHAAKPTVTKFHIDAPGLAATMITLALLVLAPGRRRT